MNAETTLPLPGAEELAAEAPPESSMPPVPRTRWAAIIWGTLFAAIAWTGIQVLGSAGRRTEVTDWFASLTPGTITALILLTMGVLVLVSGLIGLIRHAQRRRGARV